MQHSLGLLCKDENKAHTKSDTGLQLNQRCSEIGLLCKNTTFHVKIEVLIPVDMNNFVIVSVVILGFG